MAVADDHAAPQELEPREPSLEDLVALCRRLNEEGARYLVVGGFAIRAAGYVRRTFAVDLIIDTSPENEARVFRALDSLPDKAVRDLKPGDTARYPVIRVADEIVVDLMQSAGGIDFAEASKDAIVHEVDGVPIPFASPRLLWRMKRPTHREKDAGDLFFLRRLLEAQGERLSD